MNDLAQRALAVFVIWIVLAGIILITMFPDMPDSKLKLLFIVIMGPPIYLLGEGFFGWLLSKEHGEKISKGKFSIARILVAFLVALLVFGLSIWVFGLNV